MTRRRGMGYTVPRMHADVDAVASWASSALLSFSTFLAALFRMSLGPWNRCAWSSVISATTRLQGCEESLSLYESFSLTCFYNELLTCSAQ